MGGHAIVIAMACDILIPGYGNHNVNNMRLWAARFEPGLRPGILQPRRLHRRHGSQGADREHLEGALSQGRAQGRELRLKQEYFFVSATLQDIIRR